MPKLDLDFSDLLENAPPGLLLEGHVEIQKSVKGEVWMVATIGDQKFYQYMRPAVLDILAGKGVIGKALAGVMGSGRPTPTLVEAGPTDG